MVEFFDLSDFFFPTASKLHSLLFMIFQTAVNAVLMSSLISSSIALLLSLIFLLLQGLSEESPGVVKCFFPLRPVENHFLLMLEAD